MLDQDTAKKLSLVIPLLGSPHDGEKLGAANAIGRLLQAAGCDWHDLTGVIWPPASAPPLQQRAPQAADWHRMTVVLWNRRHLLRAKDREFVAAMLRWTGTPSVKQQNWILDLYIEIHEARQ